MRTAVKLLIVFFLFFITSASRAFAISNFSTDYDVTYTVNEKANTKVDLNGTITNLTDKYYASSYSIQVGFKDIKNLSASDSDGVIIPKVTNSSKGTTITLTFNRNVVGLNNKLNFKVSFDTPEVARNNLNTWDVNIPGISAENDFSSFNVIVNYPSFLKRPTYIKPGILGNNIKSTSNQLVFTKENLGDSGISIAFGEYQIYKFNLIYHLENKNLYPISTEIALPPDTNYQKIIINNISPAPANVTMDKDGNWLAKYLLRPSQSMDVKVLGKVKVLLTPTEEYLDPLLAKEYTKQNQYWEAENVKIKELAKELKTPYAIYQYVSKTLSYDFSRVESNSPRLGAVGALNNVNSAVCLEFTDLFIAIARAAGIPAREVNGFAYSSNKFQRPLSFVKDILHAWPEYYDYDKKTWIMVDPTWSNTTGGVDYFNTLDFDHIAFVIKGLNSNYPVPAGGYKLAADKNEKDVDVLIDTSFEEKKPSLFLEMNFPDLILSGFPVNGTLKTLNTGDSLIKKNDIKITTNFLKPQNQTLISKDIPPYGYQIISVNFEKTPILTNDSDTIKITSEIKSISKYVKIQPFYKNILFILGGLTIAGSIIIISLIAYVYRRISISRQKRESDLRGESEQFKK